MPEAPEVQFLKNELTLHAVGKTLEEIDVFKDWKGLALFHRSENIRKKILTGVTRRAKFLLWSWDDGSQWLVHPSQTGWLFRKGQWRTPETTDKVIRLRVVIGGVEWHFSDVRLFSTWRELEPGEEPKELEKMGPEVWTIEGPKATADNFPEATKRPFKVVLMDQKVVSGVGNLYANEGLWSAGISPFKRTCDLSFVEKGIALKYVVQLMSNVYANLVRHAADPYAGVLSIFRKERCPRCRGVITRVAQQGRGSYYCAACQVVNG